MSRGGGALILVLMKVKYSFLWTKNDWKPLLPQLTYERLHNNISFWPSGSKEPFFSLFYTLLGTFSSIFSIFHSFLRCYGLNACEMPVPMSELHCGSPSWLVPLNFMVEIHLSEPFPTPAMKFTHHDWWIICIQTISSKIVKKISKSLEMAIMAPNEVGIEKKTNFIEPDGQYMVLTSCFLM